MNPYWSGDLLPSRSRMLVKWSPQQKNIQPDLSGTVEFDEIKTCRLVSARQVLLISAATETQQKQAEFYRHNFQINKNNKRRAKMRFQM